MFFKIYSGIIVDEEKPVLSNMILLAEFLGAA